VGAVGRRGAWLLGVMASVGSAHGPTPWSRGLGSAMHGESREIGEKFNNLFRGDMGILNKFNRSLLLLGSLPEIYIFIPVKHEVSCKAG